MDELTCSSSDLINIGAAGRSECQIYFQGNESKAFLTMYPDGKIEIHKEDFPEWMADDFAREFVDCVDRITGFERVE